MGVVVARVGRRTPQPSTPSGSRPLPIRSSVGCSYLLPGPLPSPPAAPCAGGLRARPGVGAVLPGNQVCEVGRDVWASQRPLRPWPAPAGRPFAPERRDGNFCCVVSSSYPCPRRDSSRGASLEEEHHESPCGSLGTRRGGEGPY